MPQEERLGLVRGARYRHETEYRRTYIRHLRRKIEADPAHPRLILSRRGLGYYLAYE